MNFEDIKNLTPVDLNKKIREIRENIFMAKMKKAMGQMKNPISIRHMRRDIARLKTALAGNTRNNNIGEAKHDRK